MMNSSVTGIGKVGVPSVVMTSIVFTSVGLIWWAVLSDRLACSHGTLIMLLPVYMAFTPMHEATHGNIGGGRERRWLDILCGWGCAAILLVPLPLFRSGHLRHHSRVNQTGHDPDLWVARPTMLGVLLACFSFVPRYYWNFVRGVSPTSGQPGERRKIGLGMVGLGLIASLVISQGYGVELLRLWVLPALTVGGVLALLFAWMPHAPQDNSGRWTNSYVLRIPALTVPLMFHNYHLIHHLWPRIPFHRYPVVFAARVDELHARGVRIVEAHDTATRSKSDGQTDTA